MKISEERNWFQIKNIQTCTEIFQFLKSMSNERKKYVTFVIIKYSTAFYLKENGIFLDPGQIYACESHVKKTFCQTQNA